MFGGGALVAFAGRCGGLPGLRVGCRDCASGSGGCPFRSRRFAFFDFGKKPLDQCDFALERRPRAVAALEDIPPLEVVDAPFERVEAIDAVWRAIEDLNVDLKMALLLRDVVGLSYTEIADSLEITLATVKWRIYKAREEVQLALAREGIFFGSKQAEEPKAAAAAPVV